MISEKIPLDSKLVSTFYFEFTVTSVHRSGNLQYTLTLDLSGGPTPFRPVLFPHLLC